VVHGARWAFRCYVHAPHVRRRRGARSAVTILLSSAWGMGGTIRATLNLAGWLAGAGRHDVEILSLVRTRATPFFAFPAGVTVQALDDRRPGATPRHLRLIRRVLRRLPSLLMPSSDRLFRVSSLWTDVRLAHELRRRSGFLIGTRPGFNLIAAELAPPGLVTIGQEHMHLQAHRPRLREQLAEWYPRLDALVLLTEHDLEDYAALLDPPIRLEQIPNGVRDVTRQMSAHDRPVVLGAGRFMPQKGFDLLIAAFAQVAPVYPDWRLRIVGRGRLRGELKALIAALGLRGAARLLPRRAGHLDDEMGAASVFVMSSRFEGFPVILLEAMSRRLAVVSFDCPTGPGEIIEDHRNGLLVPAGDVDALAAGIRELIADTELRRRLGAAAAETAKRYTIEAVGTRWEALLADLARAS
jgi:glycosyltransferase involved in cell wall biosynthesis